MTVLATQTIEKTKPLPVVKGVVKTDKTAVADFVDSPENFIWALARKLTASPEEAEAAAQEIFTDIWRYAERGENTPSAENILIDLIARRRLIKHLQ